MENKKNSMANKERKLWAKWQIGYSEERNGYVEDRSVRNNQTEAWEKMKYGNPEKRIKDLRLWWNRCNIVLVKVPEAEKRSNGVEAVFEEIMAKKAFLKLVKRD